MDIIALSTENYHPSHKTYLAAAQFERCKGHNTNDSRCESFVKVEDWHALKTRVPLLVPNTFTGYSDAHVPGGGGQGHDTNLYKFERVH